VGVGQDGLLGGLIVFRAEVIVDGHALGGASGSVVESVVFLLAVGGFGALVPDRVGNSPRGYASPCSGCISPDEKVPVSLR
jgi:hypothetical protein